LPPGLVSANRWKIALLPAGTAQLKSLRLGCVKYLNARPLIHGWLGPVVLDHPAILCAQLAAGDLDVALVSSFEFLRNPIYRIVDDLAIASDGPVYSVFVAYPSEMRPREIELDPASATAVSLLRCMMADRGEKLIPLVPPEDRLSPLGPNRSRFLIGDQAIRFRRKFGDTYQYWDLGDEWRGVAKKPFVYALWLMRPEVEDARAIAGRLRALREENLANLNKLIAAEKEFDREFCSRYFREHLRFAFGEREKSGLRSFQGLCEKNGLLPKRTIEFAVV
jgi:chorismate dehydratase